MGDMAPDLTVPQTNLKTTAKEETLGGLKLLLGAAAASVAFGIPERGNTIFDPAETEGLSDLGSKKAFKKHEKHLQEMQALTLSLPQGMSRTAVMHELAREGIAGQALTDLAARVRDGQKKVDPETT